MVAGYQNVVSTQQPTIPTFLTQIPNGQQRVPLTLGVSWPAARGVSTNVSHFHPVQMVKRG